MKYSFVATLSTLSVVLSAGLAVAENPKYGLSWVKDIPIPTPGFLDIFEDHLYFTSFNAEPWFLSKNGVYRMAAADYESAEPELLTDELGEWILHVPSYVSTSLSFGHLTERHRLAQ